MELSKDDCRELADQLITFGKQVLNGKRYTGGTGLWQTHQVIADLKEILQAKQITVEIEND